jgi:hypothetical protein
MMCLRWSWTFDAPNTVPYMYIHGIGMIGPSPTQGCDYVAKVGNAAVHGAATGFGNLKGTGAKVLSVLKSAAPAIGIYSESGATALGFGEAAAATVGATLSGAAEAIGSGAVVYAVGSGVIDFYNQLTDPSIGCTVANP